MPAELASPVPVILAVAPGSPAGSVDPATGAAVQAASVNTTRCIRYAAGLTPGSGASQPGPGAQTFAYIRPRLDLGGCATSRTVVASTSQEVLLQVRALGAPPACPASVVLLAGFTPEQQQLRCPRRCGLRCCRSRAACAAGCEGACPAAQAALTRPTTPPVQVRVNAAVSRLPAGAVQAAAGEVVRIQPGFLDGAFQAFNVSPGHGPCFCWMPAWRTASANATSAHPRFSTGACGWQLHYKRCVWGHEVKWTGSGLCSERHACLG